MLDTATNPSQEDAAAGDARPEAFQDRFLEVFRWMVLSRTLERKLSSHYRAGKIAGGVYLGTGQEALSGALGYTLRKSDIFAPLIRDQAGRLAFGEPILDATRTHTGSVLGPMQGKDGNIHRGRPAQNMPAMISHLGAMVSVVAGMLIAKRFKGVKDVVGGTCIGEGGTSTGAFHEGINLAAVEKLPMVIAVANNQFAYSTPSCRQFACESLADRAKGYGVEPHSIDGTDLAECLGTMELAVERARAGHGPQMVVATLLRLAGHGEHDDASYVPEKDKQASYGRDCIEVARERILEEKWGSESELAGWQEDAAERTEEAMAVAQREPGPDPVKQSWRVLQSDWLTDEGGGGGSFPAT